MRWKQHLAFGAACGLSIGIMLYDGPNVQMTQRAAFAAACCLGSLFPDIDIPESTIGRCVHPLSRVINRIFGHRGFVHSPLCAINLSLLLCVTISRMMPGLGSAIGGGFLLGYAGHLVQDSCTARGVRWLWPLHHCFHIPFLYAGKESVLRYWAVTAIICVIFILPLFYRRYLSDIIFMYN